MPRRIHTAILIALSILLISCSDDDQGVVNPPVPATPPPEAAPPFLLESDVARYDVLQPVIDEAGNATVFWVKITGSPTAGPFTADLRARRYDRTTSSWGPVVTIVGQLEQISLPHYERLVAALPGGDIMVAWPETIDTNSRMLARHFSANTNSWSDPVTLDQVNGYMALSCMEADGEGNVFAHWRSRDLSLGSFWRTSRFDRAAASWTPAISLNASQADLPNGSTCDSLTRVSVDDEGNAFYAWFRIDEGEGYVYTGQIHVRRYDHASGQWSDITTGAMGMRTNDFWGWIQPFLLTTSSNGDAIVSWKESLGEDTGVDTRVMRYDHATGTWDAVTTIESLSGFTSPRHILMDAAGNSTIFFMAGDMMYTSRYAVDSHAWESEQLLGANFFSASPPVMNSAGDIYAFPSSLDPAANLSARYYSAATNAWLDLPAMVPAFAPQFIQLAPANNLLAGRWGQQVPPEGDFYADIFPEYFYDFHISRFDSATGLWQEPIEVIPSTLVLNISDRQTNKAGDQLFSWYTGFGSPVTLQATYFRAADSALQTVSVESYASVPTSSLGYGNGSSARRTALDDYGNALFVWRENTPDDSSPGYVYAHQLSFAP